MSIKRLLLPAILAISILQVTIGYSQTTVKYGSNKGSYKVINGTKLYYEEYGKGVPLLLIHGGLSSIETMGPLIPTLSQKFRVIAVDCPGQGRSEQADSLSYQLMADYLNKLVDVLNLDSVYAYGYSDGGNVALLMAADRPDKVKKVVAFAAASNTSGYFDYVTSSLNTLTPEIMEKDYRWWLDGHLKKTPQKEKWKKFAADFVKMCSTPVIVPENKLAQINLKILIIQGDNDIVKPEHAVYLYQNIKGSQLCIIPAASHFILYEKPQLLNQLSIEFFTKEPKLFDWTKLGSE